MYWFVYTRRVLFFRCSRYTKPHQQMYKSTSINYSILFCASVYEQRSCRRETQLWGLWLCFVALVDLTRSEQGEISLERKETSLGIENRAKHQPSATAVLLLLFLFLLLVKSLTPQVIKHSSSLDVVARFLMKQPALKSSSYMGRLIRFRGGDSPEHWRVYIR